MGTITCIIFVGREHPFHGGIQPTHYLVFYENDVPGWVLMEYSIDKGTGRYIGWNCIVEHPLEEALLMIAIYVMKNDEIINLVKQVAKREVLSSNLVNPYEDIGKENLEKIFDRLRKIEINDLKLVITILQDSYLLNKIDTIKDYKVHAEICLPKYIKT